MKIKFRAWDKENKVMYSPSRISWDKDGETLWVCDINGTNTIEYELINPTSELMQYTGLKDKNGKEIYERDIVKLEGWEPTNYEVVFDRGGFCLKWGEDSNFYNDIKYAEDDRGEIIGNIYENPELLTTN